MNDLEQAYLALAAKQKPYSTLFAYYEGNQPLTYMNSSRLRKIFEGLDGYFAQNWCSVVIDACRDRINLRNIEVKGAAKDTWTMLWNKSQIFTESDDVHEAELIIGESFVICWRDEQGVMEAYFNDPRMCHIFYDEEFPRVKKYAAKWFVDADKRLRLTLYYPDRLEYYISKGKAADTMDWRAFEELQPSEKNPFGEIPVFHFRKSKNIRSDLANVVPIQNAVNKLVSDMMVAAEFGAFKQRYVISNTDVQGKLRNSPDEIWDLPAGDGMGQQTVAGQFDATPLSNYLEGIDKQVTAISSITRTPKHYFFQISSNTSGEALIAMESSINHKAQDRIDRYMPEWVNVTQFMLRFSGFAEITPNDISVVFDHPETIQPQTTAQSRQMNVNAGMSLTTVWREEGKSDEWIAQAWKDKEADAERTEATLGQMMLTAERNFNGDPSPNPSPNSSNSERGTNQGGDDV